MQDYLYTDNLSVQEKQLLFKFRTRTNHINQYEPDLSFPVCLKEDSPENLLQYSFQDIDTSDTKHQHIFGNIEQQAKS